ncbi:TonB-dependent receptor [Thalassotalea sp. PS06]|uniref:TonB-dependent receptor n=1 Tax=Thalassotalea sp. PS06 TaxID=2594005 RepID=UPI00116533BE|nr:TonB-dependent receptor [Thalassotalea sp. PS06]QDO99905.1 TonB-dependent receptor [Thalassotalea sp. PS06]
MFTTIKLNKIALALLNSKKAKRTSSLVCASAFMGLLSAPALAEEEATQAQQAAQQDVEVIEVVGTNRRTMTKSLDIKKTATVIGDGISAADFGELPGLSLSDVIENIAGASGHRFKGSQNEISIRGLGSYWGYATFNGRTITNAGPGRAVNFKKFPSELVDGVFIYKSQSADLVEGGTSGTIEVSSLRAVDYGKDESRIEVTGIYNDYYSDVDGDDVSPWGAKITASTVQNFETDNMGDFGFTLGLVHSDDSNPEENYGGSSQMGICATRLADGTPLSDNGGDCTSTSSSNEQAISAGRVGRNPRTDDEDFDVSIYDQSSIFYVPNDAYWRTGEDEDTRTSIVGTFQWIPNDELNFNFDYEYSRLEYTEKRMELGLDSRRRALSDHIIGDDYTLLYAKGEARPQLLGEDRNQVDDYDGFGLNLEFTPNDDLTITSDLSYSRSYRYRLRHRSKFRSDDRYQYALDYRGNNVPTLTWLDDDRNGPMDAGFNADQAFDSNDINSFIHDGVAYAEYRRTHEEREDDIWALKLDAEYVLDNEFFSSVKAGVRYSMEHLLDYQTNDVSTTFAGEERTTATDTADFDWDDENPEAHMMLTQGIVNNCLNGHYNGNLFNQEGGGSGQFVTYDAKCFIGQMQGQIAGNNGSTEFYDIGERMDGRDGADRDVDEDILAAYVMATIDTEFGDIPVTGNIGVRAVKTKTHSRGWGDKVYITSNADGTFSADVNPTDEIERVTLDSSYTKYLPSLNLRFDLGNELYLRAAAYRAMSRFQLNAMSAGVSYEICEDVDDESQCDENTNTDYSQVVQSGRANGNHMNPYMSTNYDLSLEYYPSEDSALTLAAYYKDFTGGYEDVFEDRDIIVNLDGVDTVYPNVSHSAVQTADDESTITGIEFTANQHFSMLPYPFNGLGASVAYNYADSDFVTEEVGSPGLVPDANLFGFSNNVGSASVYWEGDKFSVRVLYKYRSKYFQPNNLPFPTRSHRYVQDQDYLDFAAKYKIAKNVSVSLKALNLLDEPQVMTRGNDTTIADYSRSGAKFYLGVKAKF